MAGSRESTFLGGLFAAFGRGALNAKDDGTRDGGFSLAGRVERWRVRDLGCFGRGRRLGYLGISL